MSLPVQNLHAPNTALKILGIHLVFLHFWLLRNALNKNIGFKLPDNGCIKIFSGGWLLLKV